MTDLQLLASEVGASERTLRRAFSQGTFRGERRSPRRLHISTAERQFLRRSWKLLAILRQSLRTEANVRFALLFGSTARGEDMPDSDVDLLVGMRDPSLQRRVDLELKLEALIGRKVNLTLLGDTRDKALLLAEVVRDGRVIVDRENRWPGLTAEADALQRRARTAASREKRRALAKIDRLLAKS